MSPCPWPDNPIFRLPAEISEAGASLALNAETAVPFARLGAECSIPARCRLCPFLFEGECVYPNSAVTGCRPPRLLAWAAGTGESPAGAALAAAATAGRKLKGAAVSFVAAVLAVPRETAVKELEEALELLDRAPAGKNHALSYSLEPREDRDSLVVVAAWAPARWSEGCTDIRRR